MILPGWFPPGAAAGAPIVITQIASAVGTVDGLETHAELTIPSTLPGDLLVVLDSVQNSLGLGTPTTSLPTGFTSIVNSTTGESRVICSYKITTGSEGGTSISGMTFDGSELPARVGLLLLQFRGDRAISAISPGSIQDFAGTANPPSQVIAAAIGPAPLIAMVSFNGTETISGITFTPAEDGQLTTANQFAELHWRTYNTAPQDTTVDMVDEGTNTMQSFYLAAA